MMKDSSTDPGGFTEYLRAPGWVFGGLGLLLGLDSAALTVVALRSVGDDPLLSGGPAALFFVMFGLGMAVIVYVMLEATLMTVTVAGQQLTVSMGVFGRRRSWPIDGMAQVATTRHSLVRHGGRGSVFAPSSRRAWVMFGIKDGVEFKSEYQDGTTVTYFISSRRAPGLASELTRAEQTDAT